jgi:hypothetical protein
MPLAENTLSKSLLEFIRVIQFCHLCAKGKKNPSTLHLPSSQEIQKWFVLISPDVVPLPKHAFLRQ